jgi:WSC domain
MVENVRFPFVNSKPSLIWSGYCGNVINAGSVLAALTDCSFICPGNAYEYCGAGNRLEMYMRSSTPTSSVLPRTLTSTSSTLSIVVNSNTIKSSTVSTSTSAIPTQTAPAIKAKIGSYSYYGCQTEGTNIRALTGAVYYSYTAMTLEMCATDCAGFTYWGVEYGGECYCGNSWNTGSVNATGSDCSFLCPGNDLEFCGAGNRLSSYYLP